jgi:hypothetical protein
MASILLLKATSESAAQGIVSEVKAGSLWGVSLGLSTTKAASKSSYALIELAPSKADELTDAAPEDVNVDYQEGEVSSFTESDAVLKSWYLRGKL